MKKYIFKPVISDNFKSVLTSAHRIALTVQDNCLRLTISWSKDYLQLHELSRFYNQLNADWTYRLSHLHTALEQTFPELKQLFINQTSKLALNVVELFPHPALVNPYSRVKLKNILMSSTDKRISKMKAYKYADRLLDLAQESYPAVDSDAIQVDEVRYYARQLIALTKKKLSSRWKRPLNTYQNTFYTALFRELVNRRPLN